MPVQKVKTQAGEHPTGWLERPADVAEVLGFLNRPFFGAEAKVSGIQDSGKGKVVLLHKALWQVAPDYKIHNQTAGTCVSHGWGLCVDVLKAVQIVAGAREKYTGDTSTEVIYAGSRVEIGKGACGRGDGSIGAWAAKWVSEYGTLVRGKYGSIDVTTPDDRIAVRWGMPRVGVPDEIEPRVKEHPVKTTSLVTDYEQARDAISQGYPVPVCSNQGFTSTRDEKGFARPRGSWAHCMAFVSVDDADSRPGLLCVNSWSENWISGPRRHDQPEGSMWVDADVCTRMLRGQDSFAISGYVGFPAQDLVDFGPLMP